MTKTRSSSKPSSAPKQVPESTPPEKARRWLSRDEYSGFAGSTRVFFTQAAYSRAVEHAASNMENEVGGVLAGRIFQEMNNGHGFIVIEEVLPARFTRQGSTFVTFTQDSLVKIINEMDDQHPELKIVGWYHTHPRLGIFLSHYDTWLHQNFFPEPWQVALVIDPHPSEGGFFIRKPDGVLDPDRYFGFYEVAGKSRASIVRWSNLLAEDTFSLEGEEFYE